MNAIWCRPRSYIRGGGLRGLKLPFIGLSTQYRVGKDTYDIRRSLPLAAVVVLGVGLAVVGFWVVVVGLGVVLVVVVVALVVVEVLVGAAAVVTIGSN